MSDNLQKRILIKITENESTILNPDNSVKNIDSDANLKVENTSSSNRLWNLKLAIENNDFTDLSKTNEKEGISNGESWDFNYKVNNLKEPILKCIEKIDTSKQKDGLNHNFSMKTADIAEITLTLENISDKPILEIEVNKEMPDYLKEYKITKVDGNANIDLETKKLNWKSGDLGPNEKYTIVIEGRTELGDSTQKSLNEVIITYKSTPNFRSGIKPIIEASTDTMSGIDTEEDGSEPGKWNCELEFENESDFELTLRKATVNQKTQTKEDIVVDLSPKEIVNAKKSWKYPFSTHDASVPQLTSLVDFTVNFEVDSEINGKIVKEPQILNVLSTSTSKVIDPPSVKTNANTDIKIISTIMNTGSANIDVIKITDKIPADFEPPTIENIKYTLFNEMGQKIKELGNEHLVMSINPNNVDVKEAHIIDAKISKLNDFLKPNAKLVMEYPIVARNPQPNVKYETPIDVDSNSKPECVGYKDKPTELPVIGIQYVQRKVKTMKSISPAGEGAFNIVIKISNKGGVEFENITVTEEIPSGFIARDLHPADLKPQHKEVDGKTILTWEIKRLDPDQSVKLDYISEGAGEFPRIEPKVVIAEVEALKKTSGVGNDEIDATKPKLESEGMIKLIDDLFDGVVSKVKVGVTYEKAGELLQGIRETLLNKGRSGVALHNFTQEIKEIASLGSKMLFGDDLDKFIEKMEIWKKSVS